MREEEVKPGEIADQWAKIQIVAVVIGGGLAVIVTALKWIVG